MDIVTKEVKKFYEDCNEVKDEWSGKVITEERKGFHECYYNKGLENEKILTLGEVKTSALRAEMKTMEFIDHKGDSDVRVGAINAGVEAVTGENIGAFARAEVLSVGYNVGENFGARLGVALDTGGRFGTKGIEAKVLGTGFMVDPDKGIGISVFGTGINFKFW